MKRIIFSVWSEVTDKHQSVPDSKKLAFFQYQEQLMSVQKRYAQLCRAEYELFEPDLSNYDDIQFFKLKKFEELSRYYDEIVYFDLDVIPTTRSNIFEKHANNSALGIHFIDVNINWKQIFEYNLDKMNMVVKTCAKNSMLHLHDLTGENSIANTGVMIGNKNSIENFRFSERLEKADEIFALAKNDNIYPDTISTHFDRNNEVYLSFIKEFYGIPINRIGLGWNYIVDNSFPNWTAGAHITHVVNKKFKNYFQYLRQ